MRLDGTKWDDLRVIRWMIAVATLSAIAVSPPHVPERNPGISPSHQGHADAAVIGNHCLGQPGSRFILCRQPVSYDTEDGRSLDSAVTVTEDLLKGNVQSLPVLYDLEDPSRVRPRHAPGLAWYMLAGFISAGIR